MFECSTNIPSDLSAFIIEIGPCARSDRSNTYVLLEFIIKFPYNAHSHWLKQRALSENREQVDEVGFQIFASEC